MKILKKIQHEFMTLLPPTTFFLIAFSFIFVSRRLMLLQYGISLSSFGTAIVGAFLAGKVVLLSDRLPFVDKFPDRPLIYNTVWKSFIYCMVALLIGYLEPVIKLMREHQSFLVAHQHFVSEIVWPHFWMVQMWMAMLFLVYCAIRELSRVVGRDKLVHMFFGG